MRIFDLSLFRFEYYTLSIPEFIAIYRELLQSRKKRGRKKVGKVNRQHTGQDQTKTPINKERNTKIPTPKPDLSKH